MTGLESFVGLYLTLILVAAGIYFAPTIIGWGREVRNLGSVFIINLFLGWTLVGWVTALAMACADVDEDKS